MPLTVHRVTQERTLMYVTQERTLMYVTQERTLMGESVLLTSRGMVVDVYRVEKSTVVLVMRVFVMLITNRYSS